MAQSIAPISRDLRVDKDILEYLTQAKPEIIEKLKTSNITDKDIPNLEPYPSDCRLAYFASEIYQDNCTIPDDWDWKLLIKVTNTNLLNGYVGAAFFNPSQQQIIIAHRGTNGLMNLKAWWTNLVSVVKCSSSPQIYSALTFADFIRDVIVELQSEKSEKKLRYQLSFTGHSLGGFLAQITTFGVKYLKQHYNVVFLKSTEAGIHGHCVSFDNPGCAEMLHRITDHIDLRYLKTIFPSTLDMTSYLSAPNIVNMCNLHVGVVMRLRLPFQEMSFLSANTPYYHKVTHNMDTIKSVFDSDEENINVEVDQIFDWPVTYGYSNDQCNFFEFSNKDNNFNPDIKTTVISIGKGRFNTIRYLPKKHSVNSCNVSLFSEDELFLLKHWLQVVQSSITINEKFTPLNLPFKDLFFQFKQIRDDLIFPNKPSMKETIKRCKQIFRWYPDKIKGYLKSDPSKSLEVIMQVSLDSYNESMNGCKVDFKDSIELENFLESEENVLMIKPNVENYEIEMKRLFNIFKQIRSKQSVNIDKYTRKNCFLFVSQADLRRMFRYTELDLFRTPKLKLLVVNLLNETVGDDVLNLINQFATNDRKVVVVTKIDLSLTSSKEIATPDFTFTDLTVNSRKFLLEYKIIKFQNETYSLATFLNASIDNWAENFSQIFSDCQFLERILNDRYIELKNDSLNLSKLENFYIQADINQNYSYDDFIKLMRDCDCDLNESKVLITHVCDLPPVIENLHDLHKLRTADLDEASEYFKSRCNEESSRKFYWFHYDENFSLKQIYNPRLYIPRSFNEMVLDETKITTSVKKELLRQEEKTSNHVTVKLTKTNNRSQKCIFRVDRKNNQVTYVWDGKDKNNEISDVRSFLTISQDGSLAEQELVDQRVVLITGDPGIGKSTTVVNLLSKIERSWFFRLTYEDCLTIATSLNDKFEVDQISKQLLKIKSDNQFDFLKYHLAGKTPIKVVFLFDEIFDSSYNEDNERRIIKFLQYLCDKTKSLVIITARETKRKMIENAMNICSIQFHTFDRKDVEGYLKTYWSELFHLDLKLKRLTLERLDDYAKRLLDKAEEIFNRNIFNFIGIPLQMKLLAEVAAPDYGCLLEQSLSQIPLELPDSLTGIYEAFVDKKLAIFFNKARVGELCSVKKGYLDFIDKKLRVFSAYKYNFYENFEELETLQQTGLIQGSEFVHQTIQEYYFARQIYAWLKKRNGRSPDKRPELVQFLLEKIFASPEFSIVRMFLDVYISKITPQDVPFYSRKIAEILLTRESKDSKFYNRNKTSLLHILLLEHCQGTVIFLLESLKTCYRTETFLPLLQARNVYDGTILCLACRSNQTLVIDYFIRFLEAQSKEIQNTIIIASFCLHSRSRLKIVLNALNKFIARIPASSSIKKTVDLITKDIRLLGGLELAATNGSLESVRNCLTNLSDTLKPYLLKASNSYPRRNALHLAVEYDHPEVVRFLIEQGWNVNQRNFYSMTAIAVASETGNLDIFRYLIENGANYKKKGDLGDTPFHRAARKGRVNIVEYFLEELMYKEVNEKNSNGDTALHHAVKNKRKRVVEILLKRDGIDVDAENRFGMRPLSYAIYKKDLGLVEMIVKAGATIDYKDKKYGESPIEAAKRVGWEDIVKKYLNDIEMGRGKKIDICTSRKEN